MITEERQERIVSRARELAALRVPFLHQGRSLSGMDCIGGLRWVLEYEPDYTAYPRDPVNGELEREMTNHFGEPVLEYNRARPLLDISPLQPCDLISMQYRGPTRHVGIVIPHIAIKGQLSLFHTDSMVEYTTEHILDLKWLRRITKVWRL